MLNERMEPSQEYRDAMEYGEQRLIDAGKWSIRWSLMAIVIMTFSLALIIMNKGLEALLVLVLSNFAFMQSLSERNKMAEAMIEIKQATIDEMMRGVEMAIEMKREREKKE